MEYELITDEQRKKFFALTHELGVDSIEAKEQVKRKYNVASLNDMYKEDMSATIDRMEKLAHKKRLREQLQEIEGRLEKAEKALDGKWANPTYVQWVEKYNTLVEQKVKIELELKEADWTKVHQ